MREKAVEKELELFPKELADTIKDGLQHGVSDEMMIKGMISLGNLLERFVKPDSPEEALIREIWDTATDEEKYLIAGVVLRIGKKKVH